MEVLTAQFDELEALGVRAVGLLLGVGRHGAEGSPPRFLGHAALAAAHSATLVALRCCVPWLVQCSSFARLRPAASSATEAVAAIAAEALVHAATSDPRVSAEAAAALLAAIFTELRPRGVLADPSVSSLVTNLPALLPADALPEDVLSLVVRAVTAAHALPWRHVAAAEQEWAARAAAFERLAGATLGGLPTGDPAAVGRVARTVSAMLSAVAEAGSDAKEVVLRGVRPVLCAAPAMRPACAAAGGAVFVAVLDMLALAVDVGRDAVGKGFCQAVLDAVRDTFDRCEPHRCGPRARRSPSAVPVRRPCTPGTARRQSG